MKKIFFIFFLIISYSICKGNGQSNFADKKYYLIDSLVIEKLTESDQTILSESLELYHKASNDTSKINAINIICEKMLSQNWIKYQYFEHQLIKKSLSNNKNSKQVTRKLKQSLASSIRNIGIFKMEQGDIKFALNSFKKAMDIFDKIDDRSGMSTIYNSYGMIYNFQGNIPEALLNYHKSLSIREDMKDSIGIAIAFNNLGVIYKNQGEYKKAIDYYEKSIKIKEKLGDDVGASVTIHNVGAVYLNMKEFDKALPYFQRSLKMKEKAGNKKGIGETLNIFGSLYFDKKEYDLSLEYYLKALKIRQEINHKRGIANTMTNLAGVYIHRNEFKLARFYAEESLRLSKEMGSPDYMAESYKNLYQIYEHQQKEKDALEMYKLYITMSDSINNESTQKATAQQQAKYEYEKQKTIDDAEHDKQIAIEQEAKSKQKVITYATAGGLGLVAVFLIFVFNRLQVTKKQKVVIETQKVEVEQQKEVVELAHFELEEKNKEITDSIQYAKRIQNAILPSLKVVKEYLNESFILYKPKDIVAGDFYWMESVSSSGHSELDSESPNEGIAGQARNENNLVLFAAADCTGHGVPGAMVSVVCHNALNRSVREFGLTDPGEILNKTREIVIQEFEKSDDEVKDGMDIAICSIEGTTLKYAGANNPLWIIRKQEARDKKEGDNNQQLSTSNYQLIETKANKQPIGQFDNPEPYTTHTIELQKDDSIYIFSDGYVDQFGGEKGKKFKAQSFRTLLLSIQEKTMDEQQAIIDQTFESWKGNLEQIDDVCVIGVRV